MTDLVRIPQYDENHPNAYARVEFIDSDNGDVIVSNMNMPFMGTFAHKRFKKEEVEFIKRMHN